MERLLKPAELAEYLQVELSTLRDWRYKGIGPSFVRTGRSVRYRPADVDEWIDEHTETVS